MTRARGGTSAFEIARRKDLRSGAASSAVGQKKKKKGTSVARRKGGRGVVNEFEGHARVARPKKQGGEPVARRAPGACR